MNQYVTKGRQVLVTGEVDASAWVGDDGEARATLEITARDVKFLGSRNDDFSGGFGREGGGASGAPSSDLQDIPF